MRDSSKSKNEERLQEVTVGELKPHNAPITLVDYDPKWPKLFDREAKRIYSILGKKVLQLEHVGSTSVPGLCALSQLLIFYWLSRILLTKGLTFLTWRRQATLYAFREPGWFQHRLFKGPDADIHLHVFSKGSSENDRMLRFRNWLRINRSDREKYARVKRKLADRKWKHVQDYADAKSSIVQEIMERANAVDDA